MLPSPVTHRPSNRSQLLNLRQRSSSSSRDRLQHRTAMIGASSLLSHDEPARLHTHFVSSGLNGRGSPSVAPNPTAQQLQQRQPQPRGGSPNQPASSANSSAQPSPSQSQGPAQPLQQQQQQQVSQPPPASQPGQPGQPPAQQQRTAYPWSQRRLLLPPPVILPKQGTTQPSAPSPSPFPRYGHSLPATATATGELFLFGGLVRETVRNDLYLFSTRDLSATLLQTAGEIPSPRVGHASALVGSVLIVWGGDTKTSSKAKPTDKQDDGLYLLNLGKHATVWLYEVF